MKTKSEIIALINARHRLSLNNSNTSYSKINKSKAVWWFNVRTDKFSDVVNLLLNEGSKVIWITLPKGFVSYLYTTFKVRKDKDAVDLEISADRNFKYMKDVKSGGTGFDFSGYVNEEIEF